MSPSAAEQEVPAQPPVEDVERGAPNLTTAEETAGTVDPTASAEEFTEEMHHTVTHGSTRSIASQLSRIHEIAFVFIVCMAQLMTQASLGNTIAPLQIIGKHYGVTNPGQLSWLIAAYSLTVGTFILIFGRCGDVFGYKRIFIIGFVWFGFWSMVAGLGAWSNILLLEFARALQGMGPAMLLPNALALFGHVYPPGPKKNMIFAIFGATAPNGAVIGMIISASFSQYVWWPWTYWSQAIACIGCAIMGWFVIPTLPIHDPVAHSAPFKAKLRSLDLIGGFLGVLGLILINIAWNQAPIVGWSSQYVYLVLVIGFIVVGCFFVWELRLASNPLLPMHLLSGTVGWVLACIACGWASFGVWVYYTFQFMVVIRGQSPLQSGIQFIVAGCSGLSAAIITGLLMHKLPPPFIMVIALSAFTAGSALVATAPPGQIFWAQTFLSLVVTCWGMDMSFPAGTVILSDAVGRGNQGLAASLINTVVNYSISIGLGIAGTVEVHVNHGGLTTADVLDGFRGAQYSGIGLAGMGVCVSILFVILHRNPRGPPPSAHRMHDNEKAHSHNGSNALSRHGSRKADPLAHDEPIFRHRSRDSNASVSVSITSEGTPSLDLHPVGASLGWEGNDLVKRGRVDDSEDGEQTPVTHKPPKFPESPRFRDSGFVDERTRSGGFYYSGYPSTPTEAEFEMRYVHPEESEITLAQAPLAHLPA